jgi:diguanylate cyclase (GGDEF)-like protein
MGRLVVDFTGLEIEAAGALICVLVFLFLYQQSRMVFFGLWACAWLVRLAASLVGYQLIQWQNWGSLAAYAVAGYTFAIVLIAAATRAAIAGSVPGRKRWPTPLRLVSLLPPVVAVLLSSGWPSRLEAYHTAQGLLLSLVYFYNFLMLRAHRGIGASVFRVSLLLLAAVPVWERALDHATYYEAALGCVLALGAMAMWGESQVHRIRDLLTELDHVRREISHRIDLDRLTGLFNQSALAARIEACLIFEGVVAVCDMDNFKEINDRYGHLIGDEILRHIGHLLQSSIRQEDEAFRWGGDEFVVLFHHQPRGVAGGRMAEIEARLREFQVRGFGVLPISFSWGTADGGGRPLREALDEADRLMYQRKRSRATSQRATWP